MAAAHLSCLVLVVRLPVSFQGGEDPRQGELSQVLGPFNINSTQALWFVSIRPYTVPLLF